MLFIPAPLRVATLAVLLLAFGPRTLLAQTALTPLENYARARTIIEAAVAAHGGVEALRAIRHARVTMTGVEVHRMQSRRIAPLDSTVYLRDVTFDLPQGRLVGQSTRGYPGGFYYTYRNVNTGTRAFTLDLRNHTYTEQAHTPADQQLGDLMQIPSFVLLNAYENRFPGGRRWLGPMRMPDGTVVEVVSVPVPPNGAHALLGFDPQTHHLRASDMGPAWDPFLGDSETAKVFGPYRMLGGLLMPTGWTQYRGGEVIGRVRITSVIPGYAIPDSLLTPPPSFSLVPLPPARPAVRTLADGVWAVNGGGSSSLVVAFRDHVLVFDATNAAATQIRARLDSLAPGKPIRWAIPSHHHDDHAAGIRQYAAMGATVVTTPGNLDYVRRLLAAPRPTVNPGFPPPAPNGRVETITGKRRVFTDGTRTVEIHDVGPNAHAEEMLVAWLPAEGILFQADLIEAGGSGVAQRGANAEATMQLAAWLRRQGWRVRTFGGVHGFLTSPEEFERLIAFPILPPD